MRIAILGLGGVGGVVAGCLGQAFGRDVVAVARESQLGVINRDGLAVEGVAVAHGFPEVVASGRELRAIDVLLVATKTFDTTAALGEIDPAEVGMAASLQNGLLKDELLAGHFGADRVIGCTTMLGGERLAPGRVRYTLAGETFFGELSGELSPRVVDIGRAFGTAGLQVQLSRSILSLEWTKQVLQAGTAPLSALLRVPLHALYRGPAARLYYSIVREAAAVAVGYGVQLDREHTWGGPVTSLLELSEPQALAELRSFGAELEARGATNVRVSMLQDVEAGRRTEIDETAGHVVELAQTIGISTPYLDFACQAVRAATAARQRR